MALTKSISANGAKGHHKFTLKVTENSTNTNNNTSSVSWSFVLSSISGGYDWSYSNSVPVSYTVTFNGTKYTGNIMSYDGSSTVTVKSGTATIAHDADGDKSISFSFSVTSLNVSYLPGAASASGTMALTNIPRQAKLLTATNFTDTTNPTITYSNSAGNAVTELKAGIFTTDGQHAYVSYRDINKTGSSYTFDLTDAEKNELLKACANSDSMSVRFYVRTKIGGNTYLHYLTKTFSVSDANPIVTGSVVDTNAVTIALTGDSSKLVKYYSNAQATMSVTAQKGAAIDENLYIIRNGVNSAYSTSVIFENVESNEFIFSAEDSRGNIGSDSVTSEMIDYVKLTCNISNNKPDADGDMLVSCTGNYFDDTFGAKANTLKVQYRYKIYGGTYGDWVDMTNITINNNTYYASAPLSGLDYQLAYAFETRAIDELTTISSAESVVKSIPVFHWGENDFVFEVPVTFKAGVTGAESTANAEESDTYEGNKTITGNLRLKGTGNYGNHLLFGDSNYCYIAELTDDVMTIHAKKIYLDASSGVYVDDYAIPILDKGTWTPTLNSSAISSYTTQYGWYSKMGQSVTIGFYIKATCKSGYQSTNISISGMPFTPLYSAAGGGMCSGAYVAANQNFQCYVAETGKTITTRTQACNNTSATNLTTSASGCWYPSGGGEVTLSGTITFIANS